MCSSSLSAYPRPYPQGTCSGKGFTLRTWHPNPRSTATAPPPQTRARSDAFTFLHRRRRRTRHFLLRLCSVLFPALPPLHAAQHRSRWRFLLAPDPPQRRTGILLLCEVALGNSNEVRKAQAFAAAGRGKHSVKGCGRHVPDPKTHTEVGGVRVPTGAQKGGGGALPTPRSSHTHSPGTVASSKRDALYLYRRLSHRTRAQSALVLATRVSRTRRTK